MDIQQLQECAGGLSGLIQMSLLPLCIKTGWVATMLAHHSTLLQDLFSIIFFFIAPQRNFALSLTLESYFLKIYFIKNSGVLTFHRHNLSSVIIKTQSS